MGKRFEATAPLRLDSSVMQESDNPYAAPAELAQAATPVPAASQQWKAIARRWELLRIVYNVLLGIAGLAGLLPSLGRLPPRDLFGGILAYALLANICYSLGPLAEMYLNWILDLGARRLPPGLLSVLRSPLVTVLLFGAGLLFSLILTFVLALLSTPWLPDQL